MVLSGHYETNGLSMGCIIDDVRWVKVSTMWM